MKAPIILRIFKNNQLVEVKQFLQPQVVIGRQADVQVDLDDDKVSPIHCMIELRDENYFISDLGSSTGTFKNGQAILDESIESGDEVQVGPFKISFFVGVPKPKGVPVQAGVSAIPAAPPPSAPPVVEEKEEPKVVVAPPPKATPGIPPVAPNIVSNPSAQNVNVVKPIIRSPVVSGQPHHLKSKGKTFAPPSEIQDLKTYLSATKGAVAEVLVAWQERVVNAKHFRTAVALTGKDLDLPSGLVSGVLVEIKSGIRVYIPAGAEFTVTNEQTSFGYAQLKNMNRVQSDSRGNFVRIEQGEVGFLSLGGASQLQVIVRYVPATAIAPLVPPLMLSGGEVSGIVLSVVLVALLAFLISTLAPIVQPQQDELTRIAQVVFQNPPKPKTPPPPVEKPPEPPAPVKPPPAPEPPKKAVVKDEQKEATTKGKPAESAKKTSVAGKAAEVAPIPNSQNKPKKFTSTVKQGGAVKLGAQAGANAQSKDVTKTGLFSAFGNEGVRKNLDQAYSGAGEVLGNAGKATGSSGMDADRAGEDLGSRFKDTGQGGKGTATQGISGVGTKGRGSGMSAYGSDFGTGEKTSVAVVSGGAEEDFVGSIDREAVRRVVRNRKNEIEGCYTRVLNRLDRNQRKALEGKVVLSWDIVDRGEARNVQVKDTTLHNREVEDCIRSRLATWIFPQPPKGMTATVQSYPFYFRSQN